MKSRIKIPMYVWFLVSMLIAGAILVELGRVTDSANPSSVSEMPSGTRAFAELLRRKGYRVRSSTSMVVLPEKDEVAVAFWVYGLSSFMSMSDSASFGKENIDFAKKLYDNGRPLILIPINPSFRQESVNVGSESITAVSDEGMELQVTKSANPNDALSKVVGIDDDELKKSEWQWTSSKGASLTQSVGSPNTTLLEVTNGLAATNRFIDRHDNAEYMLRIVDHVAAGKRKVVFLHAFHGERREPSVTEILGPWAQGGLNQIFLLFFAAIFAFGIRFGLTAVEARRQTGTRELVDAYADVLHRARAASVATDQVVKALQLRLMMFYKIPLGAEEEVLQKHIPNEVWLALTRAKQAIGLGAPPDVQLNAARELERHVNHLIGAEGRLSSTQQRKRKRIG